LKELAEDVGRCKTIAISLVAIVVALMVLAKLITGTADPLSLLDLIKK